MEAWKAERDRVVAENKKIMAAAKEAHKALVAEALKEHQAAVAQVLRRCFLIFLSSFFVSL